MPVWIKFQDSILKVVAKPDYKQYKTRLFLKLEACDKYQCNQDMFAFEVELSYLFVAKTVLQFISPLFFIIGLYSYRSYIYYYLFRKKILQELRYVIKSGQKYKIEVPLVSADHLIATKIWKLLRASLRIRNPALFAESNWLAGFYKVEMLNSAYNFDFQQFSIDVYNILLQLN